jgi:hypothetical protein
MRCVGHVWIRVDMDTRFRCGSLRERDHLKDAGVDGIIILKWIVKYSDGIKPKDAAKGKHH